MDKSEAAGVLLPQEHTRRLPGRPRRWWTAAWPPWSLDCNGNVDGFKPGSRSEQRDDDGERRKDVERDLEN